MTDFLYTSGSVAQNIEVMFDQLRAEFEPTYQIWVRTSNFDRWVRAAILNPHTNTAVTIPVIQGQSIRTAPFTAAEIKRISDHLKASEDVDLDL